MTTADMTLEMLGQTAAETCARAAARMLWTLNYQPSDWAKATEIIRQATKDALAEGLEDAREAFDAHMPAAAEATFLASLRVAGTKAGKRICEQRV